eukprot:maker-scaffold24_size664005-snap-gene-5.0 protein:Tk08328 transcript:maker-scaffold24_size664005-snap-gene-5.0-mRNA-1 annotation:"hypothetical protein"
MSLFGEEIQNEISPLRALIILPAALVFNWYSEIKKFNPTLHTTRHIGSKRSKKANDIANFDIVLTTYQTALRDIKIFEKVDWEYIVLDESQMIKNKNSKLFQAINTLTAINKISLSGTPIENSLSDLWAQMQFINDGMLGTFKFFKDNYLTPIEKHRDESASDELAKLVQPYILRRTKEEVAKDLPALTEKIEYIDLEKDQKDAAVSFFFISLKAGGVGLNLTAADYVFILDPWWNPFAEKQAIARAHRIGQEKPITVIRYIARDTIEEKILKLQEQKQSLSDDILKFETGDKKLS